MHNEGETNVGLKISLGKNKIMYFVDILTHSPVFYLHVPLTSWYTVQ